MEVKYRRLNRRDNEIRLLRLLPRARNNKHKLLPACQIFHAFLSDDPQYVALSYVWEDRLDRHMIMVDGSPVPVGKNLYDAIMALQLDNGYRIIWIDALCIDQTNDQEKSWQVNLMKDIYRQAVKVFAWLGPGDDDSDSMMEYLNSFGAKADACGIDNMRGHHLDTWRKLACCPQSTFQEQDQSQLLIPRANRL